MTDIFSKEVRSQVMRKIRPRSQLEVKVCSALWRKGLRFRINVKSLVGKPDIAIKKYKIAVFIDSCFWHCCPVHGKVPLSNLNYWVPKLKENVARDEKVTKFYLSHGWKLLRIWEHRVRREFEIVVCEIAELIKEAKNPNNRRI